MNVKRKPTPAETRALNIIEDCIRYHAPIWSPHMWAALDDIKSELNNLRAELDAKDGESFD